MQSRLANLVLRLGVGFGFLYPPFDALSNPNSWIGYFPKWMLGILPNALLLHGFGLLEVIIALLIIFGLPYGKWKFAAPLVATLMLGAIVFFNQQDFELLFRDVSIAAGALALAIEAWNSQWPRSRVQSA